MRLIKLLCTAVIALLLSLTHIPKNTLAQERNIYIGDIIVLEITSPRVFEDELRRIFQDFEIVEIQKNSNGYLLSIRAIDVGEYSVLLGDKNIVINVHSILDDIEREGIFEGNMEIIKPLFLFRWQIALYIGICIFVLLAGFVIAKALNKRKVTPESPYQWLMKNLSTLSAEDDNYFVDITSYFKRYIEIRYNCRIIGKTTNELIAELNKMRIFNAILQDLRKWLLECDMLKFAGISASINDKRRHYELLLSLVEKIEAIEPVALVPEH